MTNDEAPITNDLAVFYRLILGVSATGFTGALLLGGRRSAAETGGTVVFGHDKTVEHFSVFEP
ncbi:MAG: hypothetical protein R6U98_22005, partial [Pirellulaceae bacterium]